MSDKKDNKYSDNEILARLSAKTRAGMSVNIDDLGAIGRVLSIKDDADEERFEAIEKFMKDQVDINKEILSTLRELKDDILELNIKVAGLDTKIGELSGIVNATAGMVDKLKAKVDCVEKDVQKLKRINSTWYILLRIGIAIAAGVLITGLVFGLL